MTQASWPGLSRTGRSPGPAPEPPACAGRERLFWSALWLAAALGVVWLFAGCSEGGTAIGPGGVTAPFRGALTNDEQHFQCVESYDPTTGKVSIQVLLDRGSKVDDTAVHEIAGVANNAIGTGKAAGTIVAGAARGAYPQPIPPPLNFPACFGTQALGYAPPAPPNPTPPYPPQQQSTPHDPGSRPAMLAAPDPDGGPDRMLQDRIRRARP